MPYLTRSIAIAALIPIFAPIWSPAQASTSPDRDREPAAITNDTVDRASDPARIELDIFSGRPNPRWDLDTSLRDQLVTLIGSLARVSRTVEEPEPLGYRGLILTLGQGRRSAYRIVPGAVEIGGVRYADPLRNVEKLALSTMPPDLRALYGSLLQ